MSSNQLGGRRRRAVLTAVAAIATILAGAGTVAPSASGAPAHAGSQTTAKTQPQRKPANQVDVQLLSFNDFHGHLEATDPSFAGVPAGGVEYLASHVAALRAKQPDTTLTVAAGDLIGGSPFLSGLFQDEPSVEAHERARASTSPASATTSSTRASPSCCACRRRLPPDDGCFRTPTATGSPTPAPTSTSSPPTWWTRTPASRSCRRTRIKTVDGVKVDLQMAVSA